MLMLDRLGRKMFGEDLNAIRENFQIINITNIEQYRTNLWPKDENTLIHSNYETDFPTVVSPWPRVWLEYNSHYLDSLDSVGVLIQCQEIPPRNAPGKQTPLPSGWAACAARPYPPTAPGPTRPPGG